MTLGTGWASGQSQKLHLRDIQDLNAALTVSSQALYKQDLGPSLHKGISC